MKKSKQKHADTQKIIAPFPICVTKQISRKDAQRIIDRLVQQGTSCCLIAHGGRVVVWREVISGWDDEPEEWIECWHRMAANAPSLEKIEKVFRGLGNRKELADD